MGFREMARVSSSLTGAVECNNDTSGLRPKHQLSYLEEIYIVQSSGHYFSHESVNIAKLALVLGSQGSVRKPHRESSVGATVPEDRLRVAVTGQQSDGGRHGA
jgi:hypothetical protein